MRRRLALALPLVAMTAALLSAPGQTPRSAEAQPGMPYRLMLGQVVRDGTNPTNQAGFTTSATAERDGSQVTIRAVVRAKAAGTVVIDIETYDSVGRRIDQQWVDNLVLRAGEQRQSAVSFVPHASAPGPFTVKVGVFEPGPYWGALLHWNNSAAVFELD